MTRSQKNLIATVSTSILDNKNINHRKHIFSIIIHSSLNLLLSMVLIYFVYIVHIILYISYRHMICTYFYLICTYLYISNIFDYGCRFINGSGDDLLIVQNDLLVLFL